MLALPTYLLLLPLLCTAFPVNPQPINLPQPPPSPAQEVFLHPFVAPVASRNPAVIPPDFHVLSEQLAETTSSCLPFLSASPSASSLAYVRPSPLSTTDTYDLLNSPTETRLVPLPWNALPHAKPKEFHVMSWVKDQFDSEADDVLASFAVELESSPALQTLEMTGSGLAAPLVLLHAMHAVSVLPRPILPLKIIVNLVSCPLFSSDNLSTFLLSSPTFRDRLIIHTMRLSSDPFPYLPFRSAGLTPLSVGHSWRVSSSDGQEELEEEIVATINEADLDLQLPSTRLKFLVT